MERLPLSHKTIKKIPVEPDPEDSIYNPVLHVGKFSMDARTMRDSPLQHDLYKPVQRGLTSVEYMRLRAGFPLSNVQALLDRSPEERQKAEVSQMEDLSRTY